MGSVTIQKMSSSETSDKESLLKRKTSNIQNEQATVGFLNKLEQADGSDQSSASRSSIRDRNIQMESIPSQSDNQPSRVNNDEVLRPPTSTSSTGTNNPQMDAITPANTSSSSNPGDNPQKDAITPANTSSSSNPGDNPQKDAKTPANTSSSSNPGDNPQMDAITPANTSSSSNPGDNPQMDAITPANTSSSSNPGDNPQKDAKTPANTSSSSNPGDNPQMDALTPANTSSSSNPGGSVQLVVLGVVLHAIVLSIMGINWVKLILEKCQSEEMVLYVLIIFIGIGLCSVIALIVARFYKGRYVKMSKGIPFLKIKLISMNLFGIGFMCHCGLYCWKHSLNGKCFEKTKVIGPAYNMTSIIYTFFLFVYFALFYKRNYPNSCIENLCSLGILLANSCIWLDTLFSESDFLFKIHNINDTSTDAYENSSDFHRVSEAIEKTDPFLSPAIVEFSLMVIDLLFAHTDDFSGGLSPICTPNTNNESFCHSFLNNKKTENIKKCCYYSKEFLKRSCQVIFSLLSFALFAFTFTVLITTDSSEDLIHHPEDYDVYVVLQLSLKCILLGLVLVCVLAECRCLTFHFNVWAFVLIIACYGNVVYHMLYCFALYASKNEKSTGLSWADNIISILLAGFQTLFILGIHSPTEFKGFDRTRKLQRWLHNNFVYHACFILGMLNLGLWISDSIGEERLPVFSFALYKAYDKEVWSVINKIILPLTIFFRFHSGLDLLEMYWKYKNNIKEVKLQENIQNP